MISTSIAIQSTLKRQINSSSLRKRNSFKAVKRQTALQWEYHGGNLLRLINKLLGNSSGPQTERKEWQPRRRNPVADKGPSERSAQSKRTPTFVILSYHLKNAHKWHEGIPLARRNYLGLSISVSCTIQIVSRSLVFVSVLLSLSHLVSFMIADFNGWDVSVIPQVYSQMEVDEALSLFDALKLFVCSFNILFGWQS